MKHYYRVKGRLGPLHRFSIWAIDNNFAYVEVYDGEYWGRKQSHNMLNYFASRQDLSLDDCTDIDIVTKDEMLLVMAKVTFGELDFEPMR